MATQALRIVWVAIRPKGYLKCGVPQGSILEPLAFVLYINDMTDILMDCEISLHADDTTLFCSNKSYVDLILQLSYEISTFYPTTRGF